MTEVVAPVTAGPLVDADEVRQWDDSDRVAGKVVGQLLGGFFFVLILMMAGSVWWTAIHLPPTSDPQSGFRNPANP